MTFLFNTLTKQKEWYEKRNCTYYGFKSEENDTFILGFTLKIVQGVCAGAVGEGGWLCNLRHCNDKESVHPCFISSSAFGSVNKFRSDVGKTRGMPAIIITALDAKLLSSFVIWKTTQFTDACKKSGLKPDKLPVENRNLQNDGKTYCFSPELFFERQSGEVVQVTAKSSNYIWVHAIFNNLLPLELYNGPVTINVLEVIRSKLAQDDMSDTFICFLLICGHTTVLNLHYKEMLEIFGHVPALVATGPRNTGKTISTETSVAFLGANAEKICVFKDATLSALRERYTNDHFPIVIHDCADPLTVATGLQERFEGKDVKKHDQIYTPGATLAITCNEGQMKFLQTRFEALSRAVVIPMLKEMSPMTTDQFSDLLMGKESASHTFRNLLNLQDIEKQNMRKRAFSLCAKVTSAMPSVTDSHHRIAENYSMLIAATETFLEKTGSTEWTPKVETFVLNRLLPDAAPYYKFRCQDQSISAADDDPVKTAIILVRDLCVVIRALQDDHSNELWKCVKCMNEKPLVAIRESDFLLLSVKVGRDMTDVMDKLRQLPDTEKGTYVRFKDTSSKRATGYPKQWFSVSQLKMLNGMVIDQKDDSVSTLTAITAAVPKEPLSPFKPLTRKKALTDISLLFEPQATSTQNTRNTESPASDILVDETAILEVIETSQKTVSQLAQVKMHKKTSKGAAALAAADVLAVNTTSPSNSKSSNLGGISRQQSPELNASFTRVSVVAPPMAQKRDTQAGAENVSAKQLKKSRSDCSACEEVKDAAGNEDTYLCSGCKKRFHLGCQTVDNRLWPLRSNARRRKCMDCRNSVQN